MKQVTLKLTGTMIEESKPVVIWYHNVVRDNAEGLETALSSGLVTHVMVYYMHRAEVSWRASPFALESIGIVKESPAKLIWSRNLWPYRNQENIEPADFFNPDYYINEIQTIRTEAQRMGADEVALDAEAYAESIMIKHTEGKLKPWYQDKLRLAMEQAVAAVGQIDYIYPGGHHRSDQPYNILHRLGENRIAERTYYSDQKRYDEMKFDFEILGAYLNDTVEVTKDGDIRPDLHYYLASEIFGKYRYRWAGRKGLFIYPKEGSALVVAKELVAVGDNT